MSTILIVDDHADIRQMLRLTLGKSHNLIEADNGVSALELVRAHHPDLVVLDVMMPGELNGLQVLDAIRSDSGLIGIKVIMVTARGQASDYKDGMARGADAYFIKPFSPLQLLSCVKEFLP